MTRLLVVAPNWLGDAVMALPAIADLARAHRESTIVVAARAAIAPLFQLVDEVAETIVLAPAPRSASAWRALGAELRGRHLDAALLLPNSFHAALLAARAGIPERWGYRTQLRTPLLTRSVARPAEGVHHVEYYQQLVRGLGFPTGPAVPRLAVGDAPREAGAAALREAGWDGVAPFVAIAPGAAYGGAKRWPPASFAGLADGLASDGIRTVMVGSAADEPTGREIAASVQRGTALLNAIGRTDLQSLCGVLALARGVVSNDSGAMHLAAAVGARVTAVFGPTIETSTSPRGPAPSLVLTHAVWCRPCMQRECPLDHRCMRGLGVSRVLEATRHSIGA